MSGSIPFYQKHHRHYDRGYRSRETESAISQYQQSSNTYSSHSSKSTKGIRAATYMALDEGGLSPLPKRAKPTYLAMDKENQIIGYVVPIFRGSHEFESGLSDTEEARAKESAGYLARRDLFARGMESERVEHKSRRTVVRESAERISLSKRIHENEEYHKRLNEDSLMHTPEFVIKPRSHTVWEKQCVRLHCTISGWPEPRVVWYKNNVSIDPMAKPGKYKVESSYSVHALEINKCDFDDTAQYRVSAMNSKGETSAFASVVVKRFKGEVDESLPSPRLQSRKFGFEALCLEYGVKFETHIVEKFGVSFGLEGETLSFGCSVIIYPSLQRFQPEIEWYRDDIPSAPGRVVPTRNTDTSVVVSWEASRDVKELVGYYIESSIAGSNTWEPCNNKPVKCTRFICHGLTTGESYVFRVRAVNAAGISEFSQESEAITVKAAIASPTPPYGITVLECVRDSMVLAWKQPTFIGGADITGYFVDYREVIGGVPGKWHEANIKSVSERAYRVSELKENMLYQFQVRAANMAGVGIPSLPSETFKCEEWTIAVPGPPHDLQVQEVRKDSLVLLWKPPVYQGRDPVNGYYIDIKEADADFEMWRGVNEKATDKTFKKIKDLKEGESYVFRVRAQNKAGVGKASDPTEPVEAVTKPGTTEIVVNVDDDGVISLNFECSNLTADSKFVWSKNYMEMTEPERMTLETKGNKSKAIFKTPSEEDLGIYSCFVTHTDGASASYTLSEETLKELLKISHDHKFPRTTEIVVNVDDDGVISLNFECSNLTADSKFVWSKNYMEMTEPERMTLETKGNKSKAIFKTPSEEDLGIYSCFVTHTDGASASYTLSEETLKELLKISHDHKFPTYLSKAIFKTPSEEDLGIYSCFVTHTDGASASYTLSEETLKELLKISHDHKFPMFKQLQKESEFQKKEWVRKQGPHFVEYLGYEVTPECCVRLKCKVANMKKDSVALWYKDGREIKVNEKLDFSEGVLTLEIAQISRKDAGIYEVVLKDDRGKDTSTLNLTDQGFKDLMNQVFSVIANSSTPLKIQSTEEGIRLYTFVSYYNDELHVTWHHK
ncbi:myomesin-1 [Sinocyclocheilus grahami]|uniref:myomesin-1 n=1 Tax=Sinocyclocheilus grahami TaxID=75366 RepID=UPI0007ACA03F|nr:PREDICTED: myomesin-1 [Sinocyclocheilus grahami]